MSWLPFCSGIAVWGCSKGEKSPFQRWRGKSEATDWEQSNYTCVCVYTQRFFSVHYKIQKCATESLCCTPETNWTLQINYISIKERESKQKLSVKGIGALKASFQGHKITCICCWIPSSPWVHDWFPIAASFHWLGQCVFSCWEDNF